MRRVLMLGRGGSGKSAVGGQLGDLTGLPVTEHGSPQQGDGPRPERSEWQPT
jgi:adenylate kinase family enzyme